jgi:hypothetical protein
MSLLMAVLWIDDGGHYRWQSDCTLSPQALQIMCNM